MDKLEQKLGKLQYQRMQVEAQLNSIRQKCDGLSKEILDVANQMTEQKNKPKKKD